MTGIIVTSGGSGYLGNPAITVAAPGWVINGAPEYIGKLCSVNPIAGLPTSLAGTVPQVISPNSACQPLSRF